MSVEIFFLGVLASLFVQGVKKWFGTDEWTTLCVVAVTSLVLAIGYTALVHYGLWQSFAEIAIVAGAVYAYIILRFKNASGTSVSQAGTDSSWDSDTE